jgi:hypothetical protein
VAESLGDAIALGLRASVGSTEASASLLARFGVVGPTRARIGSNTQNQGTGARQRD